MAPNKEAMARLKYCLIYCFVFLHISFCHGQLLHGLRHRRVPGPEPVVPVFGEVQEKQQQNKHKPIFENCENYKPEVNEEAPRGTSVITVQATDADGFGANGQIKYFMVKNNKFNIDPDTGLVTTNMAFNRDEPDREKIQYVTLRAVDSGLPPLEDVCTLAVKIRDINDNSPVFDRANYAIPLAQDTQVGNQVMRVSATDVDEGDNAKITYDLEAVSSPNDIEYFSWHYQTGIVTLKRKLDKPVGYIFVLKATASDSGTSQQKSEIDVTLEVKESVNKPPTFISGPGPEITLDEGYNKFSEPIARYTASSNIPGDETLFFTLVTGRSERNNKDGTFRALQSQEDPKVAHIFLAKPLVYERMNEYTLTLQVRNSPDLIAEAQLTVRVTDINNQAPIFINSVDSGSVLEHEPPGTVVMQVQAIDADGTDPNNRVTYYISNRNPQNIKDKFAINPDTGVITTKQEFDREEQAIYAITVVAEDGAPSALFPKGPNETPQKFRIAIADKNDNPPYFPQQLYRAEIPEDQDVGSKVIEVTAEDLDKEASITTYTIVKGNTGKAFTIEEQTGFILVAKPLDYEGIKKYNLVIAAWDGQYGNETNVEITILNVNDMKPEFEKKKYSVNQEEESIPSYPIFQVKATDPDIGDPSVEQNITYFMDGKVRKHFSIDEKTGQVRIINKLDRDLPDGNAKWTNYIYAKDENGGPTGIESFVEFEVVLSDINDNAPFLDMPNGLVWQENQSPGIVGELVADDYDTPENGPPYTFEIDANADPNIQSQFSVAKDGDGKYVLKTKQTFDREKQKSYKIPILICDNKSKCNVSSLLLTIGDVNDNPMAPGYSEIFVYNYEGKAPDTRIGRVYVKDPDDWDLPDKTFRFKNPSQWRSSFSLDRKTGFITMKSGIQLTGEFTHFEIEFEVEDPTHDQVGVNAVAATVNVTIQRISKEAVFSSGSLRIKGSPEDFVAPDENGSSKRDTLKSLLSKYLNATFVDVFTVMPHGSDFTDVRFSAHGSPYYKPERLDGAVALRKQDLERSLGARIVMITIDECIYEQVNCEGSCDNELRVADEPVSVYTNTTSFVGVNAKVYPFCGCVAPKPEPKSCNPNPCLNNGTCETLPTGYRCVCPANNPQFFGPNCELLAASYNGQGWSRHPGLPACANSHLSLIFNTQMEEGTLFYIGPSPNNYFKNVTDFMAIELQNGKIRMYVNFGSGTKVLPLENKVDDSKDHYLAVRWTNDTVQLELDDKTCSNDVLTQRTNCFVQISTHDMPNRYLNTNGPLHVGGVSFGSARLQDLLQQIGVEKDRMPEGEGFVGCIKNLTFSASGKHFLYDLGNPSDGVNYTPGCDAEFVQAVVALNLNLNFLIAILVCLAIILIAVIVLAVYRKKRNVFSEKDIDCDIRENIINYVDEGGGEGDQTGYDLSVLRMMADGAPGLHPMDKMKPQQPDGPQDIMAFLQTNKDRVDRNPDLTPYDDLRHYAYEGDGNSGGSLSSLNSGTSDADLEFDYLHNFGPRFKKLADMYGEEPDSEDDDDLPPPHLPPPHHAPSESWC